MGPYKSVLYRGVHISGVHNIELGPYNSFLNIEVSSALILNIEVSSALILNIEVSSALILNIEVPSALILNIEVPSFQVILISRSLTYTSLII